MSTDKRVMIGGLGIAAAMMASMVASGEPLREVTRRPEEEPPELDARMLSPRRQKGGMKHSGNNRGYPDEGGKRSAQKKARKIMRRNRKR